jgi:hypothetical protein
LHAEPHIVEKPMIEAGSRVCHSLLRSIAYGLSRIPHLGPNQQDSQQDGMLLLMIRSEKPGG